MNFTKRPTKHFFFCVKNFYMKFKSFVCIRFFTKGPFKRLIKISTKKIVRKFYNIIFSSFMFFPICVIFPHKTIVNGSIDIFFRDKCNTVNLIITKNRFFNVKCTSSNRYYLVLCIMNVSLTNKRFHTYICPIDIRRITHFHKRHTFIWVNI